MRLQYQYREGMVEFWYLRGHVPLELVNLYLYFEEGKICSYYVIVQMIKAPRQNKSPQRLGFYYCLVPVTRVG